MNSLYLLIPIALVFVALAIKLFFWAVKSGQYDDLDTESRRILFEDPSGDAKPKVTPDETEHDHKKPRAHDPSSEQK